MSYNDPAPDLITQVNDLALKEGDLCLIQTAKYVRGKYDWGDVGVAIFLGIGRPTEDGDPPPRGWAGRRICFFFQGEPKWFKRNDGCVQVGEVLLRFEQCEDIKE